MVAISDGLQNTLRTLTKEMVKAIFNKEDTASIFGRFVVTEALYLAAGLRENFKTYSPYVGQDQLVLQMMEYNLFDFAYSKTSQRFATSMDLLVDEKGNLRNYKDFEWEVMKITEDFNRNWLEAEYNLSVAVGQNSAAYIRFMSEKDTVTSFVQYQTAEDDRVRPTHQVLNGKIFSLDDKEAMRLFPPNGYGCRCEMLQYVGSTKGKVTKGLEAIDKMYLADPKFKGSQFEINRGDLKEVFTKKQFYSDIKGLPERINTMTYDKYDLKKWSDFKDTLNPIKLDKTITGDNVKELFKKEKDANFMGFEDYYGRKLFLKEKTFDQHTKGHYLKDTENRHQLFPNIKNVLQNADEVWHYEKQEGSKSYKTRYLKFYKDVAMVVECDINYSTQGLEILTWYPMKGDESLIRKGFKIK